MVNCEKYTRQFFLPPVECNDWAKKNYIQKAPIWCSVDLRDGNQALISPMDLQTKLDFFKLLVEIGFKEIEIGFPASSDTEYQFCRALIDQKLIPSDVSIQVLTQAREHIIKKTFEALDGAENAIVHLYNSTSVAQREQVFKKDKKEIIEIAKAGAKLLNEYKSRTKGNFRFEYSPESFTGTEVEYALEICNEVIDIWQPTSDNKVIINLPGTVEISMPHIYASQIEYICKNIHNRENVIISLHPHNDRGCAVADCEMGILAGADRIEGTLFGNGERTGNADLVTIALNMFSQGIDPEISLQKLPHIKDFYEQVTDMSVNPRHPYAGQLVFAAFSGSHQDAIAKGMKWREDKGCDIWNVPYLPIDPKDIGREYESDVIRINSQSGKGGIGYLMETRFGYNIPKSMREVFGYAIKGISDKLHKELLPQEVYDIFVSSYVNLTSPIKLIESHYIQSAEICSAITIEYNGQTLNYIGQGNGRLDAVSNALKQNLNLEFTINSYEEHALQTGSKSEAAAYVSIHDSDGNAYWGVGVHNDIVNSSVNALFSAVNKMILTKQ